MQSTNSVQIVDFHLMSFPSFFLTFLEQCLLMFHSPQNKKEPSTVLSVANFLILLTRREQAFVSASLKLLSYMISGCCILAMVPVDSEIAGLISSSGAGWINSTNDIGSLANCISEISLLSSGERSVRGQAGRDFVPKHFSKSTNVTKVVEILEQMGDQRG
jgi:hypothetical protein